MADVPIINPTKPLWPTRRDGKNPTNKHRDEDSDEGKQDEHQSDSKQPTAPKNEDGHIDEYV
jgi:hypothetical protein